MTAPRRRNGATVAFIERSCEGKRRIQDEDNARAIGMHAAEKEGIKLYVYQCRFCRGWHLTRRNNGEKSAVDYYVRGKYRTKDKE